MSENRLVTLNEAAEIIGYSRSRFMMLKRESGSFPEPAAKVCTGYNGIPQHQFLLQDILMWAEPYYRAVVNTRTKREHTKKPRNAAQVVIEKSDFNQMAKAFITHKYAA
jgi:hypothetical protein